MTNDKKALYVIKLLSYVCGNLIDLRDFLRAFSSAL